MELSSIAMRYSLSRLGMDTSDSFTDLTEVIALLGSSTGGSLYSSPSLSTSLFSSCYIIYICIQIAQCHPMPSQNNVWLGEVVGE